MKELSRFLRRFWNRPESETTYDSFAEAVKAAGLGPGAPQTAEVVFRKTERYANGPPTDLLELDNLDVPVLFAPLIAKNGNELRVIDFGGACGLHYFVCRYLYGRQLTFKWHVVEITQMVERAQTLESSELRFFSDLEQAKSLLGRIDLVFSSGALQYVPDQYGTLEKLVACGARHIVLTRLPLTSERKEIFRVQEALLSWTGPGPMPTGIVDQTVHLPMVIGRRQRIEDILSGKYAVKVRMWDQLESSFSYWGEAN